MAVLTLKDFRAFLAARRKDGISSRSLARTLSALRSFFRWLEQNEITKNRAVLQVARPKIPHALPKPLTIEKASDLVSPSAHADKPDWIAARDTAVLLLLYGAGLRISARRWQREGVLRCTLRNWMLRGLYELGVSPLRLARSYRPHSSP